jgi:hypothetical protein
MAVPRLDVPVRAGQGETEAFYAITGDPQGEVVGCLAENDGAPPVQDFYIRYRDVPSGIAGQVVRKLSIHVRFHGNAGGNGKVGVNVICQGNATFQFSPF